MQHGISYRKLSQTEIQRIAELDRAEEIFESYQYKENNLILMEDRITVTGFDSRELHKMLQHQKQILAAGGKVIAAFENNQILGAASVEKIKRGSHAEYCKLDILYVSKNVRGKKSDNTCFNIAKQ
nr:hypothetical protein [Pedobacter panaciterrae]